MTTRIDTRFATAEDTAQILGVGRSRLKKLLRLATSTDDKESVRYVITGMKRERDAASSGHVYYKIISKSKPKTTGKTRVSSRKRASGKVAKNAR